MIKYVIIIIIIITIIKSHKGTWMVKNGKE